MTNNPFLLPPAPREVPDQPPEPAIDAPVSPPVRDPEHYISIPPSVESATHRIARPAVASEGVAEPEELSAAGPSAGRGDESETEANGNPPAEETWSAAVPGNPVRVPASWSLALPDGSVLPVDGPILLGRDPAPILDRPGARLISLIDPARTVSKTHVLIEPDPAATSLTPASEIGLRLTDLHSTNGVAVTRSGVRTVLAAGGSSAVGEADVIELGSFTLSIVRS